MRTQEKLIYTNERGESIEFSPASSYHVNFKDVTGLSDVRNAIYSTNSMGQDGDTYLGYRIESRDIDIVGYIKERDKQAAQNLRRKLNRILNPQYEATLTYVFGDFRRVIGCKIDDAPIVVGVGPGFTAGEDCHAVVETMRGHTLGRVIYSGSALPNTNIPGLIGGFAGERVLRAPCDGIFTAVHCIGDTVEEGETIGFVEGQPMKCTISGVLRGVLDDGVPVKKGMKSGDVDPRCKPEYCTTISDKALAVGGGVVEAVLYLSAKAQGRR